MNYEEAKQKAIDAFVASGMTPTEAALAVTAADIKLYGWSPSDPTVNCDTTVVLTQETLNLHGSAAMEEAKGNQVLTNALNFLIGAAGKLMKGGAGVLIALVLLNGCSSDAGRQLTTDANASLTRYVEQRDGFDKELIDTKAQENIAKANELYEAAVESHTQMVTAKVPVEVLVRTVNADGTTTEKKITEMRDAQIPTIDPRIMTALQTRKGQMYAETTGIQAGEYARIAKMNMNAANAARSISDLSGYLGEQAKNQMSMSDGLTKANELLDMFLASKKKATAEK